MAKGMRWLAGGIAAVLLAGLIAWVLVVPAADWLARHDVGPATGTLLETARTNARGGLLTLAAGLVASAALVFTARNLALSRRAFELTAQGQVTDRYTKAIEQLGSNKIDIRIGGIYALERIAGDSARDHPTVMEVLAAFIREHSRESSPLPTAENGVTADWLARADVQAAIAVIGRRDTDRDVRQVNLAFANLARAELLKANLHLVFLLGASLTEASLHQANLSGAFLIGADLTEADLSEAALDSARLTRANLTRADLVGANLSGADLADANLTCANLAYADLSGAHLIAADLTEANFAHANLTRAQWPDNWGVPEGWLRDSSSGELSPIQAGKPR